MNQASSLSIIEETKTLEMIFYFVPKGYLLDLTATNSVHSLPFPLSLIFQSTPQLVNLLSHFPCITMFAFYFCPQLISLCPVNDHQQDITLNSSSSFLSVARVLALAVIYV